MEHFRNRVGLEIIKKYESEKIMKEQSKFQIQTKTMLKQRNLNLILKLPKTHFELVLLWNQFLIHHCKFPQNPFEVILISIMIQTYSKYLRPKILQLFNNYNFKVLKHCHFREVY